jgi:hypothetical protein
MTEQPTEYTTAREQHRINGLRVVSDDEIRAAVVYARRGPATRQTLRHALAYVQAQRRTERRDAMIKELVRTLAQLPKEPA